MKPKSPIRRIAWITDIHMDHQDVRNPGALDRLGEYLEKQQADILLLSGDISEYRTLEKDLLRISRAAGIPLYFVLGNHDYYFGSVDSARKAAKSSSRLESVTWLGEGEVVDLGGGCCLVGCGGWGDARRGNLEDFIVLTDFAAISDLAVCVDNEDFWTNNFRKRGKLVEKLQELGAGDAAVLSRGLKEASDVCSHVLVMTHVTPFFETSTYKGRPGDEHGMPCFVWEAARGVLDEYAAGNPDMEISVISGHTHDESSAVITPNLRSWSAGAEYGELRCRMIELEGGRLLIGNSTTI